MYSITSNAPLGESIIEFVSHTDDLPTKLADKQKLESGITFITGQKGMVGVNNVKTRPGNSYFIDLGWDVDDIVVRFNQDGKKWEIKEQDEEVFHPAGDGNLPDEWSGNGLEAVKRIDAGLKKINDGQEQ